MTFRCPATAPLARIFPGAIALPGRPAGRSAVARPNRPEVLVMKWETPQAIDYRFGMEITMYIANR